MTRAKGKPRSPKAQRSGAPKPRKAPMYAGATGHVYRAVDRALYSAARSQPRLNVPTGAVPAGWIEIADLSVDKFVVVQVNVNGLTRGWKVFADPKWG